MCGIYGYSFIDKKLRSIVLKKLKHRGPDSDGFYEDSLNEITLIHTRLAITDQSLSGKQPIVDTTGRYVLIFNGEIYNYRDLRKTLNHKYQFSSSSDTEVVLYGLIEYGVNFFKEMNGMFSIVFYDKHKNLFLLARDNHGIKPLYYAHVDGNIIFSSEIEVMLESNKIRRILRRDLVTEFLDYHYILGENTPIKDIYRIPTDQYLIWTNETGVSLHTKPKINVVKNSEDFMNLQNEIQKSVDDQTEGLTSASLYLSGGVDSTVLLSCLAKTGINLNTYCVRYDVKDNSDEFKFNTDSKIAKITSSLVGSHHREVILKSDDLLRDISKDGFWVSDSLISHPNSLAMRKLSELAKTSSKVVFSGSGADEIFGGYDRYLIANKIDIFLDKLIGHNNFAKRKLVKYLSQKLYHKFHSQRFSENIVISRNKYENINKILNNFDYTESIMKNIMQLDRSTWLKNFSLSLSDSTSMINGIEERVPYLTNRIICSSKKFNSKMLVDNFGGKAILKKSFQTELMPVLVMQSKKRGFSSPIGRWVRENNNLSKEIAYIISPNFTNELVDVLDYKKIKMLFDMHLEKKSYQINNIWAFASLQSYIVKNKLTIG